jgi:hypothetical protein
MWLTPARWAVCTIEYFLMRGGWASEARRTTTGDPRWGDGGRPLAISTDPLFQGYLFAVISLFLSARSLRLDAFCRMACRRVDLYPNRSDVAEGSLFFPHGRLHSFIYTLGSTPLVVVLS